MRIVLSDFVSDTTYFWIAFIRSANGSPERSNSLQQLTSAVVGPPRACGAPALTAEQPKSLGG